MAAFYSDSMRKMKSATVLRYEQKVRKWVRKKSEPVNV
jgi:hypothetical protein